MREKNSVWYYFGGGMESFGVHDKAVEKELPDPKDDEVLARVDAVAICASDIKMIQMGNEYPLFKNRNFKEDPAVLGHELSLTIEKVGKNLKGRWKKGMRVGIQPDVYMNGDRYCIGVNVPGGMQKYIMLEKPIFYSDQGESIFEIDKNLSYATVAQLEPNACVEAAYGKWGREDFSWNGSLLIYVGKDGDDAFILDKNLEHKKIFMISEGEITKKYPENTIKIEMKDIHRVAPDGYNDILVLGNIESEQLKEIVGNMNNDCVFCWLPSSRSDQIVEVDIAKVHYGKVNWLGSDTKRLSDAFKKERQRHDLKENGRMLIMGGAGAMGRIHTARAIMNEKGPRQIVVAARSMRRLETLMDNFHKMAIQKGKKLQIISTNEHNWKEEMWHLCNREGFDDVVISAPGTEVVNNAVPFLRKDGMIVLFSGTKYGSYANLPLGYVASFGARINASSGTSVENEKAVLNKIENNQCDLNMNVMAIAGFNSIKKAILEVKKGRYPGKVIIYPQIDDLPIVEIEEIREFDKALYKALVQGEWSKQAERVLYIKYGKEDKCHE